MSAGMRRKGTQVFILVHSYRATSSLTLPKVESTKNSTNYLQTQQFLNTTRTAPTMLKNPISAHLALQETLSRSD